MRLDNQTPGTASNDGLDPATPPTMRYARMFVTPDGISSLDTQALGGFVRQSLGGQAAAMWMRHFSARMIEVWFTVLPVGWVGEWHESPGRQWVTALSGRWWIETADGRRIEMGPGEIHWGDDIGTAGNHGHRSGQMGDVPCVQLMIRHAGPPDAD